jgi:hypothetical protein
MVLYVAETWSCIRRKESKLQADEMKFLEGSGENQER